MSEAVNVTNPDKPKHVLLVIANPAISTTLNIPVGFWGAELTHAYNELTQVGYQVTIASPNGGKCELDAWSDPRDSSKYTYPDLITMGFINTPELWAQVEHTVKLASLNYDEYDAIMVAGGQSPMFTFRDNQDLHTALRTFYEADKPTAITATARRPS